MMKLFADKHTAEVLSILVDDFLVLHRCSYLWKSLLQDIITAIKDGRRVVICRRCQKINISGCQDIMDEVRAESRIIGRSQAEALWLCETFRSMTRFPVRDLLCLSHYCFIYSIMLHR